ncbi:MULTISPECIES: TetR/AcrR family transcriptional regulator [unclassified Sphingomonas]|uniref:TetR/AcrR family transcriptional regulator n=1 Tax=unclassified Sphingomonas TaxID=196159 RepID=UPI0006F600CB|nr:MULTISPECIES: TetR/AcrR family transcriptional regulator [unclassified Sphingomonas]KQM27957.1 TetR family transcriptional regulator [Sphingomonas sp. Leaf9]KQM44297.1 TetR family transcriptional regulator [Sphingomonas sp. Leaf11]
MRAKRVLTDRQSALPALAEAFREHGYDGASLAVLTQATGLGKGSLYNFFPGGKEEMMAAVLDDIDRWFTEAIFRPLEDTTDPATAIAAMFDVVSTYFLSGRRVCVIGSLGLNAAGEVFAARVRQYFARWIGAVARCLERGGVPPALAMELAEEAVSGIQGAIVLTRALGDEAAFRRVVDRLRSSLLAALDRGG